jgi:two-component system, NtrC family, nitrogen regulation sensor histidine kinase NtrY
MVSKHYTSGVVLRLSVIIVAAIFLGICIVKVNYIIEVFLSAMIVFLGYRLIKFFNHTNEQISYFISAVKNDDTTLRFPARTGDKILNELHKSLNELNIVLQETKMKGQFKERYFSEIIKNIGTGILIYNPKEFVLEVNPATLELFGIQTLTHLSQLNRVDPVFKELLVALKNNQKQVLQLKRKNEVIQLITRCSIINLKEEEVFLLTLQDIKGELERKEIDSWVKLIRVLSHEIMNSLAPVTSIAQSLKKIWKEKIDELSGLNIDNDTVKSTINGLDVIADRGDALISFVQSYRMLTKVPNPVLKSQKVYPLIDSINILVSTFKDGNNLSILVKYPSTDFDVVLDEQMLMQVILNLVKNSAEALKGKEDGLIEIEVNKNQEGKTQFRIIDNGPGIPAEISDEIFIPFFTTKEGGMGVGLSHSIQIVRVHGGTINHQTENGKTVFSICI